MCFAEVLYLVTCLWFQTRVDVLLHVQQVLQQSSPHRLAHLRVSGCTPTFKYTVCSLDLEGHFVYVCISLLAASVAAQFDH